MPGTWKVVVPDRFKADLEAIGPDGYDWTGALAGVRWYLSHDPWKVGYATQDSEVRIYLQDRPLGFSGFKVFYLIEGNTVTLLRAKAYSTE